MTRECVECKEPFKGRTDKKFCSDLCRNAYNNRLNSDATNYIRNINNILRKNRRILGEFIPNQAVRASKSKLIEKGFNFQYYTSAEKTKKNATYYYCYDYGYLALENEYFLLVKKKDGEEK